MPDPALDAAVAALEQQWSKAMKAKRVPMFTLRCVGCRAVDTRAAAECAGPNMPQCKKCYSPMVLESASA